MVQADFGGDLSPKDELYQLFRHYSRRLAGVSEIEGSVVNELVEKCL